MRSKKPLEMPFRRFVFRKRVQYQVVSFNVAVLGADD
jgi:hypothetical protein